MNNRRTFQNTTEVKTPLETLLEEIRSKEKNKLTPLNIFCGRHLREMANHGFDACFEDCPECFIEVLKARLDTDPQKISTISAINLNRAKRWHKGGLEEWTISDWSNAMAGEAGEVCNAVKKLRRIECDLQQNGDVPASYEEAVQKVALEIGDTFLYLNLLAQRLGIDMYKAIKDTFNRVSEREGFSERMQ